MIDTPITNRYNAPVPIMPAHHSTEGAEYLRFQTAGLARTYPNLRLAVTHTGAQSNASDLVRTPEGQTGFPDLLRIGGAKCLRRVRYYYESTIGNPDNPVYRSLASQYANVIRRVGTPHLLAQNINPLVSILKADEFGLLDEFAPVYVTGVMHDTGDMRCRLDYVRRRLAQGRATITLIAVSDAVRQHLLDDAGIAAKHVRTVRNGIDVRGFRSHVERACGERVFERVRVRNGLPAQGQMLFTSARRVSWKGHLDIHALLLRRLMYLDSIYLGRTRAELVQDPVYARYLDSAGFEELFTTSTTASEPIR